MRREEASRRDDSNMCENFSIDVTCSEKWRHVYVESRLTVLRGPWIIEDLNGLTPLTSLACKNRIDLLLLLLTRLRRLNRADLNFPDLYGNTVLHYLALRRNDDAIKQLGAYGLRSRDTGTLVYRTS